MNNFNLLSAQYTCLNLSRKNSKKNILKGMKHPAISVKVDIFCFQFDAAVFQISYKWLKYDFPPETFLATLFLDLPASNGSKSSTQTEGQ